MIGMPLIGMILPASIREKCWRQDCCWARFPLINWRD